MLRMMQPSTKCRNGLGEFAQVQAGDKLANPKLTVVYAENQNESSLVSFQGGHPSEAEHLWFCFFFFFLLFVANHCHTQEKIVRLLTGDLFDSTLLGRPRIYISFSGVKTWKEFAIIFNSVTISDQN